MTTKRALLNCVVLVSSLGLSLAGAYYAYKHLTGPPPEVVYRGKANEYAVSFYSQRGEPLSELDGGLKIMTDPFVIYRTYPNQRSISYSIDKHGFREGHTSDKPRTAMILGGSVAFGQGLDRNEQTFASRLSHDNEKYNVINAGVVGFLSGQELSQMVHYLDDFRPSLYITFDGWNDIFDPHMFSSTWPVDHGPIGFNNAFFMIENRLAAYYETDKTKAHRQAQSVKPVGNLMSESDYSQKVIEKYLANIQKMWSFARARDAALVVVFQPELTNKKIKSEEEKRILEAWNTTHRYLDKEIPTKYRALIRAGKALCTKWRMPCLDINEEAEFSEARQSLFDDVVHPNQRGHEIIARILKRLLD